MPTTNHNSAYCIRVGVPGHRPRVKGACRCMWEPGGLERNGDAGEWRVGWEGEDLGRHLAEEEPEALSSY